MRGEPSTRGMDFSELSISTSRTKASSERRIEGPCCGRRTRIFQSHLFYTQRLPKRCILELEVDLRTTCIRRILPRIPAEAFYDRQLICGLVFDACFSWSDCRRDFTSKRNNYPPRVIDSRARPLSEKRADLVLLRQRKNSEVLERKFTERSE